MFKKKNDVPEYVKRSAKYKKAQKEVKALSAKGKKIWMIALCAVLLVAVIGVGFWFFAGPSGDSGQAKPAQSGRFDPSLGVPDADIESFVKERYERVAEVTATFDAKVADMEITHDLSEEKKDKVTVKLVAESEICKKTFQLDLTYQVVDKHWNLEEGNESVLDTQWNTEKLIGLWSGGVQENFRYIQIDSIDLENHTANFINMERKYENERIYEWKTGEIEILPSNDSAPYVIDYAGMIWAETEQLMFPTDPEYLY